jgi:zinc and cadmium transporter
MNYLYLMILFLAAFIPGYLVIRMRKPLNFDLKYMLVFAGAFIFSITMVHLLPELFTSSSNPRKIGLFVLIGFFMQIFIDFTTSGVEHGHLHSHHQSGLSPLLLMFGLCMHAVMDGSILVHPGNHGTGEHLGGLIIGIVLHKIPAAIALMSILNLTVKRRGRLLLLLLLFSLASPVGLVFSEMLNRYDVLGSEGFLILFAIVSGNFLHISTTIYFESSPDHSFHRKKILISLLGAALAILIEFLHH